MIIDYDVGNFKPEEFYCKCKYSDCDMKKHAFDIYDTLMIALDIMRKRYAKPITINSGMRCEAHNKAVGGAVNSKHTRRMAVDISGKDFSALKDATIDVCEFFGLRFIVYDKEKFIHIERS